MNLKEFARGGVLATSLVLPFLAFATQSERQAALEQKAEQLERELRALQAEIRSSDQIELAVVSEQEGIPGYQTEYSQTEERSRSEAFYDPLEELEEEGDGTVRQPPREEQPQSYHRESDTHSAQEGISGYQTQYSQTEERSRPSAFYDPLEELAEEGGPPPSAYGEYERVIHHPFIFPDDEEGLDDSLFYIGGVPVISSPFLGERAAYDGSDLTVNLPHPNQDLRLLEQRQRIENVYLENNIPLPTRPIVDISGDIEVFTVAQKPFDGSTTGDLDVGEAELHFGAILNPWITSMITLQYQSGNSPLGGPRTENSNVRVHKAFITWGNLNRNPFYATVGQLYVPFGRFRSSLLSTTVVRDMIRTKERTAIWGFKQPGGPGGFMMQAYGFKSNTGKGRSGDGGINVGYVHFNEDDTVRLELGSGIISNVGDGERYLSTGRSDFEGFGATSASGQIDRVPAINLNGSLDVGDYTITTEYVVPTTRFNPNDLSFNGRGARPTAFHIEGVRSFEVMEKPANVAIGYSSTRESLALDLPRHRASAAFNISIWRNTIETFELRYDRNYESGTTAGGIGPDGDFILIDTGNTLSRNSWTAAAQIGVYF